MSLPSWLCLLTLLAVIMMAATAFVFLILLAGPKDVRTVHEEFPCPRCNRVVRYKTKRDVRIRCSCGNVMPAPDHPGPVRCPGCLDTVHSKVRKPARVRCKCGNISDIPRDSGRTTT